MKLLITLEIPGHAHSARAHRHEIGAFLDTVKQQIGATDAAEGTITRNEPFKQTPVGLWKFVDEETN